MRRAVALILFAACFLACCPSSPPAAPATDSKTAAERVKAKSVALVTDEGRAYCGGVWLSRGRILTAFHCVATLGEPPAQKFLEEMLGDDYPGPRWDPSGQTAHYCVPNISITGSIFDAVLTGIDRHDDLAILEAPMDAPIHDIAHISTRVLHDGDELDIVGSTLGLPFTYSHGYISAIRGADDTSAQFKTLQISGPVYLGNSGGGAFDDHGDLVGILDFMPVYHGVPVSGISFAIHRDVLLAFVGG